MAKTKTKPIATQEKTLRVNEAWAKLFSDNEKATKAKRLSDDQLVREMQKLFPDKKEKTTITRPNMIRSIYNKGTNMFETAGKPKTRSRRYDENGDVIEGRVVSKKPKVEKTESKVELKPKAKIKAKVRVKAKAAAKQVTYSSAGDGDDRDASERRSAAG